MSAARATSPPWPVGDPAPRPPVLRPESEIVARWVDRAPLASILCPTFQHADYIRDALDGFLGQETDFPFEIIVRDDASTDGTRDIIRSYADRYPSIIRAVVETTNNWPQVVPHEVMLPLAGGRYLTICEGDDYWVDPEHLSRSVRTLLADPGTVAVVSPCHVVRDGLIKSCESPDPADRWNYYLPIRSLVYRRDTDVVWVPGAVGDMSLALALQMAGAISVLEIDPPVVHVQHAGGIHAGLSYAAKKQQNIQSLVSLALHLAETGELALAEQYRAYAAIKVAKLLREYAKPETGVRPKRGAFQRLARAKARFRGV